MSPISRKRNCWASYRGDCSDDISDEHLLSKSLFPEKIVYVSGFEWCKAGPKRVGINSLVRKILCVKHNNALSEIDKEAVAALRLFRYDEAFQADERGNLLNRINGIRFERWLLKTAINLSVNGDRHIGVGMTGSEIGRPSPYLVEVAFNSIQFSHGLGVYFLHPDGYYPYIPGEILLMPIVKDDLIGGYYFGLRGQPVFLNLLPGTSPAYMYELGDLPLPKELKMARLEYRPAKLATVFQDGRLSMVKFDWA